MYSKIVSQCAVQLRWCSIVQLWRANTNIQVCQPHRMLFNRYFIMRSAGALSVSAPSHGQDHHDNTRNLHSNNKTLLLWSKESDSYPNATGGSLFLAVVALLLCNDKYEKNITERRFIKACKENDVKELKELLKKGVDVNGKHPLGWYALHAAVINGHLDVVRMLIEKGADINVKEEYSSATRVASQARVSSFKVAKTRDSEFCSFISNYVSYSGFTPLHYAILGDDERIVKFLLDNGADPTLENNRGFTPSDYCTNEAIRSLLEEYTNKYETIKKKKLLEERRRFPLEKRLKENIVGQEGPIAAAASTIRRREMGWADDDHPMVLLFLGSSGIGKTELAKQIARYIHKERKEGFIRLDMSEYQEKHEVAKLIGSPPGYIGHDKGGQLTSSLRKCPNAVVLFDEVDKAHPDVLTVMLQLFDEGRLTDGQGDTIECKEALFVMTSNLASDEIAAHGLKLRREAHDAAEKYRDEEKNDPQKHIEVSREFKEKVVEPILKRHFKRDEFLGRINEMLYFLPFSRSELNLLVEKQLHTWKERAMQRHSIDLSWEREVLDVLADGYNVKYGARSIKHEVERTVIAQLANAFEQEALGAGDKVCLVVESQEKEGTAVVKLKVEAGTNLDVNKPIEAFDF